MARHDFAVIPASYVYLRRGGEVLLQQRQNTGYMDGHWVAGAAGHVEAHETARAAAVREAREELGIDITPEHLTLVTVMQRTDGSSDPREQRVDWFWTATRWEGTPRVVEPEKATRIAWHSLSALPAPIPAYERSVLVGLRDGDLALDTAVGFSV